MKKLLIVLALILSLTTTVAKASDTMGTLKIKKGTPACDSVKTWDGLMGMYTLYGEEAMQRLFLQLVSARMCTILLEGISVTYFFDMRYDKINYYKVIFDSEVWVVPEVILFEEGK